MLSLHLLQNCMVYVNTLMIQTVLARPDWRSRLTARDLHALTPLFWGGRPIRVKLHGSALHAMSRGGLAGSFRHQAMAGSGAGAARWRGDWK